MLLNPVLFTLVLFYRSPGWRFGQFLNGRHFICIFDSVLLSKSFRFRDIRVLLYFGTLLIRMSICTLLLTQNFRWMGGGGPSMDGEVHYYNFEGEDVADW